MLLIVGAVIMDFIMIKVFIVPALHEYKRTRQLMKRGQINKGPIIGYNQKFDPDGLLLFAPIAKLTTNEGKEYLIESNNYNSLRKDIGTLVTICYEAEYPEDAIINPRSGIRSQLFLIVFHHIVMLGITIGAIFFPAQD